MSLKLHATLITLLVWLSLTASALAGQAEEERSLNELRNTVVNLLQTLVDRGIITREQAQAMVANAQAKAAADAAATAQQEKKDQGAVRVPYVPQIVKDEISKEVVAELGPSVKKEVVEQISSRGSLFSALPDWVQRMRWTGDLRIREEGDMFGRDNVSDVYLDYNQVNSKGGIDKAGTSALLNTNKDRDRFRLRLRFGFDTDLGSGWSAGMRLATGTGEIFLTTNQTEGNYGQKYQISVDQGFIGWSGQSSTGRQIFTAAAGRIANPWLGTDLVWYNDLTFEGLASSYRFNLSSNNSHRRDLFATLGAFPLSNYSPFDSNQTEKNKWLAAAQLGADLNSDEGSRLQLGAAYYDYLHIVGQRNLLQSTLLNWSAPALVQKGNTLYDISNTPDPTVNLFALAADYKLVDLIAVADLRVFSGYSVGFTAEAVKNIGFDSVAVMRRTGTRVAPRTLGYRADLSFGSSPFGPFGTWQAALGYRYLQRDAVLDAFNDEDFHLGGTDTKGYTVRFDYSFNPRVWLRLKYLSADAIEGPPLAIDVWQLDLNTRF